MDLSKIKSLIDLVGNSNITELTVADKGVTVRIFRSHEHQAVACDTGNRGDAAGLRDREGSSAPSAPAVRVAAPISGIVHASPAPGEPAFVQVGDRVQEGQTLFILEAMKVFNTVTAPRCGRIVRLERADRSRV